MEMPMKYEDPIVSQVQEQMSSTPYYTSMHSHSPSRSPNSSLVPEGTAIIIRDESMIHPKLQMYAHTNAVVVEVPVHPNTWYGVLLQDNTKVKIRRSAFMVPGEDLDTVHLPPLMLDSERPGMRVQVGNTPEVMQNFPHLFGSGGVILEVPIPPNVWYTVQLDNNQIIKLDRGSLFIEGPSGFRTGATKKPKLTPEQVAAFAAWVGELVQVRKGPYKGSRGRVLEFTSGKFKVQIGDETMWKRPNQVLLTSTLNDHKRIASDLDSPSSKRIKRNKTSKTNLIGALVEILAGKHQGTLGFVGKGGNGYYSVELRNENGEPLPGQQIVVMKRSADLRIIDYTGVREFNEDEQSASSKLDWVGQRVIVTTGRHMGKAGTIASSGHGFYGIHLDGFAQGAEIMKRGQDLELQGTGQKDENNIWQAASILLDLMLRSSSKPGSHIAPISFKTVASSMEHHGPHPFGPQSSLVMTAQVPVSALSDRVDLAAFTTSPSSVIEAVSPPPSP